MQINIRFSGFAFIAAALAALLAWYLYSMVGKPIATTTETSVIASETPVVMRTAGGLLEVATVKATERFTRKDTREFWGIDLGTTVSQIQAPVVYRYHIQLAREWQFTIKDKTCLVHAPDLRPSLPVAFDTAGMQKYSQSGWARFNKDVNLTLLERSITRELQSRAESPNYLQLVREPARATVKEFVTKWLLEEQQWKRAPDYAVIVVFPGEPIPASPILTPGAVRQ